DATWQEAIVSAAQGAGLPEFEARNATRSGWRSGYQVTPDWLPDFSERPSAAPVGEDTIHYPAPWPRTLTRTLLTTKRTTVDGEDLAALLIIEQIHTACDMPAKLTISEYARRASAGGWPVDRRLIAGALGR